MKFVQIEWEDAHSSCAWVDKDYRVGLAQVVSVGFVIYEDENYIQIANTYNKTSGDFGDPWGIPKGCIKKVTELSLAADVAI